MAAIQCSFLTTIPINQRGKSTMKIEVRKLTKLNNAYHVRLDNRIVTSQDDKYVQLNYLDDNTILVKKLNLSTGK